jgi:O-antigen/teichoic acid export membrane protein
VTVTEQRPAPPPAAPGLRSRVRAGLRDPMHRSAYALLLGSATTSVLGLAFWGLAARLYPPEAVGVATAAITAMTFLANLATLGLKNGLLRFLPAAGTGAAALVLRSYLLCGLVAAAAAVVFLVGQPVWAAELGLLSSTPAAMLAFVLATVVWVLFVLQDHVLAGLHRAVWVPVANTAYSVLKIGLLVVLAGTSSWLLFASYALPAVVAVLAVNLVVLRDVVRSARAAPAAGGVTGLVRFAAGDHAATLLLLAVVDLMPLLVLARSGLADSAFYYLAFTIAYSLYLITADVGSALVAEAARDTGRVQPLLRRACANALLLAVPAVAVGCLLAPVVLGVLGPEYAAAGTTLLQLLLLSAIPHVVVGLAVSLAHVRRQMRRVLGIHAAMAVLTFAGAEAGLRVLGLVGAGWAWLGTQTLLAVVLLLTQMRFLWRREPVAGDAAPAARAPRWPAGRRAARRAAPYLPPVLAAVLWTVPLLGADPRTMTDLGLLSLLTPLNAVALLVLTAGFAGGLARGRSGAVLAAHVVTLIGLLHATPAVVFGTVRYSWSWKHVGIVDFVQRHHAVDVDAPTMAIYHNWPGLFAGSGVLVDLAGLPDARALALWAPLAFNLANLLALRMLLRTLSADRRRVWLALWVFFVITWVGQDYFSPQAFAFVLLLVVLALVVRRFRASWPAGVAAGPLTGAAPVMVAGVLVVALASSHQITPVALTIALVALAATRQVRAWPMALFTAGVTAGWAVTAANAYTSANVGALVGSFLDPVGNVGETLDKSADLRGAQVLVSLGGRAVIVVAGVLALAGVYLALRRRALDGVALVLLVSPAALVVLTSFGGETLFRVFLFAAPAIAYFAAAAVLAAASRPRARAVLVALVTAVLLPGFLLGYFGKDQQNYFTTDEVAALRWVSERAAPGSLLVVGNTNYPRDFRNYENVVPVDLSAEPAPELDRLLAAPAPELHDWLVDPRYTEGYIVITRSQKIANDSVGPLEPGALDALERRLRASSLFERPVDLPSVVVFVPRGEAR